MKTMLEKIYKAEARLLCKLPRTKLVKWQLSRLYKKIDKLSKKGNAR